MKVPNFDPIFEKEDDFCEKSSSVPVSTFIPHQAISLTELISRFERGQRLNVHSNFTPGSNFTHDKIVEETFDEAPPDGITDVTDVHAHYQMHKEHVEDYKSRKKSKQAKQATSGAQQASEEDTSSKDLKKETAPQVE